MNLYTDVQYIENMTMAIVKFFNRFYTDCLFTFVLLYHCYHNYICHY